jgi:hypothetical protein
MQQWSIPTNQVSILLATQVILIYTKVGKGSKFEAPITEGVFLWDKKLLHTN